VPIDITLLTKPGCHLCEQALEATNNVLVEFRSANPAVSLTFVEKNILEDSELEARYREEIPVLLINGNVHNYWRIDETRFREALDKLV
jgi:glutaredoxin